MNYGEAVRLIANEKLNDLNFENISEYASTILVSKVYNVSLETIAEDIIRIRSFSREISLRFLKNKK